MTYTTELTPVLDRRKSFYHKAVVAVAENSRERVITLWSYDTPVCEIRNGSFNRLWSGYSATTMRHVNDFCYQYGIDGGGKKWWTSLKVVA